MAKSHQVISMIGLLRSSPGITISELATHFGRSERSIYRWLHEITVDLRLPVVYENGGYRLPSEPEPREVSLDPQELLVLRMSLRSRLFGPGSPFKQHAESAWAKIRDASRRADIDSAHALSESNAMGVGAPPFETDSDTAQALRNAVAQHLRLRAVYRSQKSDRIKDYTIDPYALVFRRHSWYVLAFSYEHDEIIQMRLGRFQRVEPTGETFKVPADFSVDGHFRWSWEAWSGGEPTRVLVRFHPRVAKMIAETQRHPTQVVRIDEDGSALFEATVSGIQEFGSWVLGYGGYATVLEPQSLREYVLSNARGILSNYQPGPSKDAALL